MTCCDGAAGDADAALAFDTYCYRVRSYVGAYLAALGSADAVVFTGGVGENAAPVRAAALAGLERLGVTIDPGRNDAAGRGARRISPDGSGVAVLVVPADEELEIARPGGRPARRGRVRRWLSGPPGGPSSPRAATGRRPTGQRPTGQGMAGWRAWWSSARPLRPRPPRRCP